MREYGIKNYIEYLSNSDSKLNLDTLDEVFTSLENIYLFNEHICDSNKNSSEDTNNIECHVNDSSNKYLKLYIDLYNNAKSKWKHTSCYKNEQHQCIDFDVIIKHWSPKLYNAFKKYNQNGSSNINFLLNHYNKKYST
jgi:hypothetical protein